VIIIMPRKISPEFNHLTVSALLRGAFRGARVLSVSEVRQRLHLLPFGLSKRDSESVLRVGLQLGIVEKANRRKIIRFKF